MTNDEKLMQQALEDICATKLCEFNSMSSRHEMIRLLDKAITALRERLAQPEQSYPDNFIDALKYDVAKRDSEAQQAYEDAFINGTGVMLGDKRIDPASIYKEPEQEPLTGGDERRHIICLCPDCTKPAQQQEPVAWMHPDGRIWTFGRGFNKSTFTIPLYTSSPASKPWVGLDDTDLAVCDTDGVLLARYWERVLREKNA